MIRDTFQVVADAPKEFWQPTQVFYEAALGNWLREDSRGCDGILNHIQAAVDLLEIKEFVPRSSRSSKGTVQEHSDP